MSYGEPSSRTWALRFLRGLFFVALISFIGICVSFGDAGVLTIDGSERVIRLNDRLTPLQTSGSQKQTDLAPSGGGKSTPKVDVLAGVGLDVNGEKTPLGKSRVLSDSELLSALDKAIGHGGASGDEDKDSADAGTRSGKPDGTAADKQSKAAAVPADQTSTYRLKLSNATGTVFDRLVVVRQSVLYKSAFSRRRTQPLTLRELYNALLPNQVGSPEAGLLADETVHRIKVLAKPNHTKTMPYLDRDAADVMDWTFDFNRPLAGESIYLWEPNAYDRHARAILFYEGLSVGLLIVMAALLLGTWFFSESVYDLVGSIFTIAALAFVSTGFGFISAYVFPFRALSGWLPFLSGVQDHAISVVLVSLLLLAISAIVLVRMILTFDPVDYRIKRSLVWARYALLAGLVVALAGIPYGGLIVKILVLLTAGVAINALLRLRKKSLMGARMGLPGWAFILAALAGTAAASMVRLPIPDYYLEPALFAAFIFGTLLVGFGLVAQAAAGPFTGLAALRAAPAGAAANTDLLHTAVRANGAVAQSGDRGGRYELALAATKQGLWDWTLSGDRLYLSPYADKMLGSAEEPFVNTEHEWYGRIHPRDQHKYRSSMTSYLALGSASFALKFRILDKNSHYRQLELRAACVPDKRGKPSRCIGTIVDLNAEEPLGPMGEGEESPKAAEPEFKTCALTGLLERDSYIAKADRLLTAFAEQQDGPGDKTPAMLVVEIDRFPTLNEGLGREKGDQLLKAFAQRLASIAEPDDVLGRVGGDEFAVFTYIPTDLTPTTLARQAQDVLSQPIEIEGTEVHPSATIGTAVWKDDGANTGAGMIAEAEKALSEAKAAGRSRVEEYKPGMGEKASRDLALEADLRRALDNFEMEVFYQPIMDLRHGRIAGFEALLRWNHPERGLLNPDQFVPVAEEVGLIVRLSRFCLSMASLQLSQWQQFFELDSPLFVAVNISTRQLWGDVLISDVSEIMNTVELIPDTLKLEVTESCLIDDEEEAHHILSELRKLKVAIVLDDYGTGHSSLERLKTYPFDAIKIDKRFVREIATDKESEVMVSTAIKMAKDLSLDVVAEGVETEAVGRKLHHLGCGFAQGFVFGAPMSAMDAQAFIANYWAK